MKDAYLKVRSAILWTVSLVHFGIGALLLMLLRMFFDDHQLDSLIRINFRNIQRLAGVRVRYHHAPGFQAERTCIFISNHVNMFDPFLLYDGMPQVVRGLELESHFDIPIYGWLMRRFGNVPVPDMRSPSGLKRTFRLTKAALDRGIGLVVFAEGHRTLDGRVDRFEDGGFLLAHKFKVPIVPVSIVGAYDFKRKGDWMLRPATVDIYLHDTIETTGLSRADLPALRDRVYDIVAGPVHARLENA